MSEQPPNDYDFLGLFRSMRQGSVPVFAQDYGVERDIQVIDATAMAQYFKYERAPLPPQVRTIVSSYPDELTSGWIRGSEDEGWLWVCAASRFVMFNFEGNVKVVSVDAPVVDAVGFYFENESKRRVGEMLIVLAHERAISVIVDGSSIRKNPIGGVEITALSEHYIGTADGAVYRYRIDNKGVLLQKEWLKMPQKIVLSPVVQILETSEFVYALHSNSDVSGYTNDGARPLVDAGKETSEAEGRNETRKETQKESALRKESVCALDVAMGVLEDGIVELVPDGNCVVGLGRNVGDMVYLVPASRAKECEANTYEIPIPDGQAFLYATVNDGVLSVYTYPKPECAMVCVSRTKEWSLKVDDEKVLSTVCLRNSGGSIKRKRDGATWDKDFHIGDLSQEEEDEAVRLDSNDTTLKIRPRGEAVPWSLEQYKPDKQNTNLSAKLTLVTEKKSGETVTINLDSDKCDTWEWGVLEPASTVRLEFNANQPLAGKQTSNNNMRIRKYLLLKVDDNVDLLGPKIGYSDQILGFGRSITRIRSGRMLPDDTLKQLAARRMKQLDMSMWSPNGTHVACHSSEIGMEDLVISQYTTSRQVICTKKVFGTVLALGQQHCPAHEGSASVIVCTSKECIRLTVGGDDDYLPEAIHKAALTGASFANLELKVKGSWLQGNLQKMDDIRDSFRNADGRFDQARFEKAVKSAFSRPTVRPVRTHATTSKRRTSTRTGFVANANKTKERKVHVEWDSKRFRDQKKEISNDEPRAKAFMKPLMTHMNQRMNEWMIGKQKDGYIDPATLKEWAQFKQDIEKQNDIF